MLLENKLRRSGGELRKGYLIGKFLIEADLDLRDELSLRDQEHLLALGIREEDVSRIALYNDKSLEGITLTFGGIIGITVESLRYSVAEHGSNFLMGYNVAWSKYMDNSFTPFARPIEQLEEIFGASRMYKLRELVFKGHERLNHFLGDTVRLS